MLLLAYPPRCWFYKQSTTHSEWIQSPRWIPQHEIEGFPGGSNQSESVTIPASLLAVWICDPVPHELHCAANLHNVCRSLTCRWSPKLRLEFKNIKETMSNIQILNMYHHFLNSLHLTTSEQPSRLPGGHRQLPCYSQTRRSKAGPPTYPGKP